jgi:hypothetical protein
MLAKLHGPERRGELTMSLWPLPSSLRRGIARSRIILCVLAAVAGLLAGSAYAAAGHRWRGHASIASPTWTAPQQLAPAGSFPENAMSMASNGHLLASWYLLDGRLQFVAASRQSTTRQPLTLRGAPIATEPLAGDRALVVYAGEHGEHVDVVSPAARVLSAHVFHGPAPHSESPDQGMLAGRLQDGRVLVLVPRGVAVFSPVGRLLKTLTVSSPSGRVGNEFIAATGEHAVIALIVESTSGPFYELLLWRLLPGSTLSSPLEVLPPRQKLDDLGLVDVSVTAAGAVAATWAEVVGAANVVAHPRMRWLSPADVLGPVFDPGGNGMTTPIDTDAVLMTFHRATGGIFAEEIGADGSVHGETRLAGGDYVELDTASNTATAIAAWQPGHTDHAIDVAAWLHGHWSKARRIAHCSGTGSREACPELDDVTINARGQAAVTFSSIRGEPRSFSPEAIFGSLR